MWIFRKKSKIHASPGSPDWVKFYLEETQKIVLTTPSRDIDFVVVDLEATGLDIHKDRIISFASIPVHDFEIFPGQSFHCFVHQTYFDPGSVLIHGLLHKDIADGLPEKEYLETIIPILTGKVIVGHHVGYDVAMVNQALKRHFDFQLVNPLIDTGDLYKKSFPSKFAYPRHPQQAPSLDDIAGEFDILTHHRHSAMGDATITAFIFMKLWKMAERERKIRLKNLL